jgi:ribosomal protein L11 methyltransferase
MTALKKKHPGWRKISIHIHPVANEPLSEFLFELGCTGIVTEDQKDTIVKAYLSNKNDLKEIQDHINGFLRRLKGIFPEIRSYKLKIKTIKDQDWSRGWRKFFYPEKITDTLMIIPAWDRAPMAFEGHIIKIDPGPAFGTGKHPTTQMCLKAMEGLPMPLEWTMLDVGTSSGILAIYGAKLGASSIKAIDIDKTALHWAERNVRLNGLLGAIRLSYQPVKKINGPFTLLVANLTLGEIQKLFSQFYRIVQHEGWIILSGILSDQARKIEKMLGRYQLGDLDILQKEEWVCMISKKK